MIKIVGFVLSARSQGGRDVNCSDSEQLTIKFVVFGFSTGGESSVEQVVVQASECERALGKHEDKARHIAGLRGLRGPYVMFEQGVSLYKLAGIHQPYDTRTKAFAELVVGLLECVEITSKEILYLEKRLNITGDDFSSVAGQAADMVNSVRRDGWKALVDMSFFSGTIH